MTRCMKCGRMYADPAPAVCPECGAALTSSAERATGTGEASLRLRASPILAEALASVQAGEDFSEALLRTLKARHPEQAVMLLPAFTRLIEFEAKRSGEDEKQAIRRLAAAAPGPEVAFTDQGLRAGSQTTIVRVGDREYHSLDEVPPDLRRIIEDRMRPGGRSARRAGCLSALAGGWLWALLRLGGR